MRRGLSIVLVLSVALAIVYTGISPEVSAQDVKPSRLVLNILFPILSILL